MPPKPSMLSQIAKSESYAERNLSRSDFPPDQAKALAELKQKVLADISLIRLLLERESANSKKTKDLMLLVGELAMAVSTIADIHHTEILEREEGRIREEIRDVFNKREE